MSDQAPAVALCGLCPALPGTRATWVYTDPQGYEWHLCRRHYQPISEWLDERQRRRQAAGYPERTAS